MHMARSRRGIVPLLLAAITLPCLCSLLIWDIRPKLFPPNAHALLSAFPPVMIAFAWLAHHAAQRGSSREWLKAALLAAAFFSGPPTNAYAIHAQPLSATTSSSRSSSSTSSALSPHRLSFLNCDRDCLRASFILFWTDYRLPGRYISVTAGLPTTRSESRKAGGSGWPLDAEACIIIGRTQIPDWIGLNGLFTCHVV